MERISRGRARFFMFLFLAVMVFFGFRLYDLQVIRTGGSTDNTTTFTTYTTVKAARGDILDQNIVPMIKSMEVLQSDDHTVLLKARVCCQNPTLNPMQLHGAIVRHLPDLTPDFVKTERIEIYDADGNIFR